MAGRPKSRARRALEAAQEPQQPQDDRTPAEADIERQARAAGPYRWADATPGNAIAVTHGAHSPRIVEPRAQALVEAYLADNSSAYLREPAYRAAVWAWARAEVRVELIAEWIDDLPMEKQVESTRGQTSPLELLRKFEETASRHRARLGLDPMSRARLGRDVAATRVDVAALLTKMRAESEGSAA